MPARFLYSFEPSLSGPITPVDLDCRIELLIREAFVAGGNCASPQQKSLGLFPWQRVTGEGRKRAFEECFRVRESIVGGGNDGFCSRASACESAPIFLRRQDLATA